MYSRLHPVFPLLLLHHLSTHVHVHKFSVCWGPPTSIYSLSRRNLPVLNQYQLSIPKTCQIFKLFWTYLAVLFCNLIFTSFTSWFPNCDRLPEGFVLSLFSTSEFPTGFLQGQLKKYLCYEDSPKQYSEVYCVPFLQYELWNRKWENMVFFFKLIKKWKL